MRFFNRSGVLYLLPAVLLAGVLFIGCGDDGGGDGGGGPTLIVIADFEGSWVADSYRVTSSANPMITLELIALGGAFAFDADDAGAFAGRGFIPASVAGMTLELPFQGSVELIDQDTLQVNFTPELPPFLTTMRGAFTLEGDMLTITDTNATFDFDGDTVEEPAIFEGTMVKYEGSEPPVIFVADFEGSWEAATYRVTSVAVPAITMEVIALGATFEFDIDDAGGVLGDVFIPASIAGEDVVITGFTGAFSLVKQDTIQISFTPEHPPFLTDTQGSFTLIGDTFNIMDENSSFDFDGDLVEEPAIFEATMMRTSTAK
jgi:hypothetical protein